MGRRSFSVMAVERSRIRMRCRIMPRWRGVVSLRSLFRSSSAIYSVGRDAMVDGAGDAVYHHCHSHLFLLPASSRPSTVELIVPSALSTTFSQVLVTSHPPPTMPWPLPREPAPAPRMTW